jgi:hypothetical protein
MPVFSSLWLNPKASCAVNELGFIDFDGAVETILITPGTPLFPIRVVEDNLILPPSKNKYRFQLKY